MSQESPVSPESPEQKVLPYEMLENGDIEIDDPLGTLTVSADRSTVRVYSSNWITEERPLYNGYFYLAHQGEISVPMTDLDHDTSTKVRGVLTDIETKGTAV